MLDGSGLGGCGAIFKVRSEKCTVGGALEWRRFFATKEDSEGPRCSADVPPGFLSNPAELSGSPRARPTVSGLPRAAIPITPASFR